MPKLSLLLATFITAYIPAADAALLRPYSAIKSATVRLADLFDQLGSTPDRVLGKGPAPGERILVGAAQLAAIARDFNVDWRPATGNEKAIIERRGRMLAPVLVADAIRQSLLSQGAPELSEIAMPATQPIIVPSESTAKPEVTQCNYDPASGHFTAVIALAEPDTQPVEQRLSGTVVALAIAAVATRRIPHGATITETDIHPVRLHLALLHGAEPATPEQILGMTARHDISPGQPVTMLDLMHPELVARGSLVRMQLHAGGITLAAEGIAKESGAQGDHIAVENPVSHALVQAEIVGAGEVRVDPARLSFSLAAAQ